MSISEKTLRQRKTGEDDSPAAPDQPATSGGRRPVGSDANRPIVKLGIASLAMAILPIGTYFGTLGRVFEESNTTAAAISAIVVTNLILIGFILAAVAESDPDTPTEKHHLSAKDS
ncbi:hypothetical protein, variant [Puccinia triticina 1-1 BBBD Race 1]|uniref:Vacuolar ATPase assembly integral membrane protein VMA21 n=2 Tax=Puccinia triticina TaxID=208348 RepID=A0A0C4F1F8_PUCT1|nr:uncharacterized protein PtA15_13A433 [Puccinia triticina]OAV89341.1 hypothetical protein PTTG_06929 [Puccinia triticina 1-1 BBBD Race 1]OAV89342.1 hypothetical protein, variant [Puccinia triticina 1-1 BBBD Race 1]WAQ91033.1 hypothetical protein PtA15_13A433 [Puccinia triticina]WAR61227.1 hypothetical protein PtB15_13B479 [Puccinia triticina]